MKLKILSGVGFFWLLCLSSANAAFFDPKYDVRTVKTEHFYIHYPRQVAPVAKDLMDIVEPIHVKLSQKFNWNPAGRTHLVLVDKTDESNGLATVIPANYVLLYVTPPGADSTLDHYKNYLELLFTHEYTHIIHIDQHYKVADPLHWIFGKVVAPNGMTPGWMREGIAAYEESVETGMGRGNGSYDEMLLRANIYEDKFPKIDEVAGVGIKWPGGDTQYVYGVKFFMWLAEKYGEDRIIKYTQEYASGVWLFSLNNKARRVWGKSFYQLWKEWEEDLRAKYLPERDRLIKEGVTSLEDLLVNPDAQLNYYTPHPDGFGYAHGNRDLDSGTMVSYHVRLPKTDGLKENKKPIELKATIQGQMSFSRDASGLLLAYSATAGIERFNSYNEIYIFDTVKKTAGRLSEKKEDKKAPKESMRASDPDFSPLDGGKRWVLMVRTELGTDNLYVFDRTKRKGYYLTNAAKYTQFSNPRFSPDGNYIAVSRRDNNGNRDIYIYTKTGQEVRNLNSDAAVDNHPIWSPNGRYVYFTSDKTGINNIHRVEMNGGAIARVTNVLTGVMQPAISPDGQTLYVTHFSSVGTDLKKVSLANIKLVSDTTNESGKPTEFYAKKSDNVDFFAGAELNFETVLNEWDEVSYSIASADDLSLDRRANTASQLGYSSPLMTAGSFGADNPVPAPGPEFEPKISSDKKSEIDEADAEVDAKVSAYESALQDKLPPSFPNEDIAGSYKYHAFPQTLVPRYILPTFATLDDSYLIGFSTGRFDPLYRHSWALGVNYRSDNQFIGGNFVYSYTRYIPTISVGFNRYSLNWGNLFGAGANFYEQRHQGFVGVSYPWKHSNFLLSYFYEDRDNLTPLAAGIVLPTLDRYAGLHFGYIYSRYKQYANSISQENGPFFKLDFDVTDSIFGSAAANEQEVLTADFRYYFEMPWSDHHVFGLRAAGGYAWGDVDFSGAFRMGGPFGEGNLAGYSSRLFPFRGLPGVTFAGDRALLFSAEYRLPLVDIERGPGTWPIYLRKLHLAFLADYGDMWARNGKDGVGFFDDFMLGVGAELRGDFVMGYGLPITARAGYAIIITNRARVAGLTDTTFGMNAQNGNFYLQFGTSF